MLPGAGTDGQIPADSLSTTRIEAVPVRPPSEGALAGPGGRYQAKPGSKVRIEGTSNVHDWQVEGNIIGGHLELGADFPLDPATARLGNVEAEARATIPSRSLKSVTADGRPYNAQMDSIMYGLLLEPTHKAIQYTLGELTLTAVPKGAGEPFVFASKGALMVAGVTNVISMPIKMAWLSHDRLQFSGSLSVKMTDFGIQPPEPRGLGIKTGDEVKLSFDWVVGKMKQ